MSNRITFTERTTYNVNSCPCGRTSTSSVESYSVDSDSGFFVGLIPRTIKVGEKYIRCQYCNGVIPSQKEYFQDLEWYKKVLFVICYNTYFISLVWMLIYSFEDVFYFLYDRNNRPWIIVLSPLILVMLIVVFALALAMDVIQFSLVTVINAILLPVHMISNPIKIARSFNGYYERKDMNNKLLYYSQSRYRISRFWN